MWKISLRSLKHSTPAAVSGSSELAEPLSPDVSVGYVRCTSCFSLVRHLNRRHLPLSTSLSLSLSLSVPLCINSVQRCSSSLAPGGARLTLSHDLEMERSRFVRNGLRKCLPRHESMLFPSKEPEDWRLVHRSTARECAFLARCPANTNSAFYSPCFEAPVDSTPSPFRALEQIHSERQTRILVDASNNVLKKAVLGRFHQLSFLEGCLVCFLRV